MHWEQSVFRPKYFTETENGVLLEDIKKSLDEGNVVGAVFRDMNTSFDIVNHSVLISKLHMFKFSDKAIRWFGSYPQRFALCM